MIPFDNDALAMQLATFTGRWAKTVVADVLARVNTRADHHADTVPLDGSGRARGYDSTPGSVRQSFGAWVKGARDTLIDDMRAVRRHPDDAAARFSLMLSSAVYAAAGSAFSEIVVSGDAVPGTDPLMRPTLHAKTTQAKGLRAAHLSSAQQEAVIDAASGDPERVDRARRALGAMIAEGDERQAQIAIALLGQIGDPLNRHKLNRLGEEIEKQRWQAAPSPLPSAPQGSSAHPLADVAPPARTASPRARHPQQVVESGGEDARRVTPGAEASTFDIDNPYGEDN